MLLIAAFMLICIGAVHSYFGERYILIRLFRRDNIPKVNGSSWYTKRVLRFAWHLTTVSWWGFAAILVVLEFPTINAQRFVLSVVSIVFFVSGVMSASSTKFQHLSWPVFWLTSVLCGYVALLPLS